jgi:hypothetical protein
MSREKAKGSYKMKDLAYIDRDYREERRNAGPTDGQKALATLLDSIGNWPIFCTFTFRPNLYEQVAELEDGSYVQNKRVQWCGGPRIPKVRPDRNGNVKYGSPSVAPGWSADKAMKQIINFVMRSKDLRQARWFVNVEPHKFRDCYHGHGLFANCVDANWAGIGKDWQTQYGRFGLEMVDHEQTMDRYLGKHCMGKRYGKEDFRYAFSHNCRRALNDDTHKLLYRCAVMLFTGAYKENFMTPKLFSEMKRKCVTRLPSSDGS